MRQNFSFSLNKSNLNQINSTSISTPNKTATDTVNSGLTYTTSIQKSSLNTVVSDATTNNLRNANV